MLSTNRIPLIQGHDLKQGEGRSPNRGEVDFMIPTTGLGEVGVIQLVVVPDDRGANDSLKRWQLVKLTAHELYQDWGYCVTLHRSKPLHELKNQVISSHLKSPRFIPVHHLHVWNSSRVITFDSGFPDAGVAKEQRHQTDPAQGFQWLQETADHQPQLLIANLSPILHPKTGILKHGKHSYAFPSKTSAWSFKQDLPIVTCNHHVWNTHSSMLCQGLPSPWRVSAIAAVVPSASCEQNATWQPPGQWDTCSHEQMELLIPWNFDIMSTSQKGHNHIEIM